MSTYAIPLHATVLSHSRWDGAVHDLRTNKVKTDQHMFQYSAIAWMAKVRLSLQPEAMTR